METRLCAPALPATWRLLRTADADGVHNMAIDAALLSRAARTPADASLGTLRVYGWSEPTVSFGRNEVTRGRYDAGSLAAAGLAAVRRPTGGRALLHAREVTYSVTFPLPAGTGWQEAYVAVNDRLLAAVRALGVPAELVPQHAATAMMPDGPPCFAQPDAGEIVVGGAKLVGSAVWRDRHAYLQHGSILLHDDQPRLAEAARAPLAPSPAAALSAFLPPDRCTPEVVAGALADAFRGTSGPAGAPHNDSRAECVTRVTDDPSLLADIARFTAEFRSPVWLWRR